MKLSTIVVLGAALVPVLDDLAPALEPDRPAAEQTLPAGWRTDWARPPMMDRPLQIIHGVPPPHSVLGAQPMGRSAAASCGPGGKRSEGAGDFARGNRAAARGGRRRRATAPRRRPGPWRPFRRGRTRREAGRPWTPPPARSNRPGATRPAGSRSRSPPGRQFCWCLPRRRSLI